MKKRFVSLLLLTKLFQLVSLDNHSHGTAEVIWESRQLLQNGVQDCQKHQKFSTVIFFTDDEVQHNIGCCGDSNAVADAGFSPSGGLWLQPMLRLKLCSHKPVLR